MYIYIWSCIGKCAPWCVRITATGHRTVYRIGSRPVYRAGARAGTRTGARNRTRCDSALNSWWNYFMIMKWYGMSNMKVYITPKNVLEVWLVKPMSHDIYKKVSTEWAHRAIGAYCTATPINRCGDESQPCYRGILHGARWNFGSPDRLTQLSGGSRGGGFRGFKPPLGPKKKINVHRKTPS